MQPEDRTTQNPVIAKHSVSYQGQEMSDKLLEDLESHEPEARRYDHAESAVSCILFSIYNNIAGELGYKTDQKDTILWKLAAWKEKNTRVELNKFANGFHITYQSKVIIPTIKAEGNQVKQTFENQISLFSQKKFTNQEQKARYIALDTIHYTTSRLFKNQISQEEFHTANTEKRHISDDQILKFILEIAKAKAQYLGREIHKVPTSPQNGVLLPFDDNQKVGILGDWGSGLPDSFDLLDELVLNRGATIILHLGDVYYAGFPEEFKKISDKIKQLRKKVPRLRYYTIPGNHDFYTNGGPFYDSLNDYNDDPNLKQKFGFFCLRNKSNTLQYVGLDTGYTDSRQDGEINPGFLGATVGSEELAWAKQRIEEFKGQTIFLTHHQPFSPYQKTLGDKTKFGYYNPQVNTSLCEQLFDILPEVSVWYWGHEHRLSFFKPNAYGIPCSRTLGNSSFQVHHQDTYKVKYTDYNPVIPRCNPGRNGKQDFQQPYFDHTGAVVRFAQDKINVCYIDMTSSYMSKSVVTRQFQEEITRPDFRQLSTNKVYRVKDSCGLSYCFNEDNNTIWLNYKPDDLIIEKADDPNYSGPITSGMELYIKLATNNKYFSLSQNSKVVANPSRDPKTGKFKFISRGGSTKIKTGDGLMLVNVSSTKDYSIGREYSSQRYWLATGGTTEYTPVQVYDPTAKNTDLKQ